MITQFTTRTVEEEEVQLPGDDAAIQSTAIPSHTVSAALDLVHLDSLNLPELFALETLVPDGGE